MFSLLRRNHPIASISKKRIEILKILPLFGETNFTLLSLFNLDHFPIFSPKFFQVQKITNLPGIKKRSKKQQSNFSKIFKKTS